MHTFHTIISSVGHLRAPACQSTYGLNAQYPNFGAPRWPSQSSCAINQSKLSMNSTRIMLMVPDHVILIIMEYALINPSFHEKHFKNNESKGKELATSFPRSLGMQIRPPCTTYSFVLVFDYHSLVSFVWKIIKKIHLVNYNFLNFLSSFYLTLITYCILNYILVPV